MPLADLDLPVRLLAGGGPSSPHPRVLRALGLPVIGQFDPAFTAVMDDVMQLARQTFLTSNERCFAVSGLAAAGLEAVLNSVIEDGDQVAIAGGPRYTSHAAEIVRRCGGQPALGPSNAELNLVVAPMVDPVSGELLHIRELASTCHAHGAILVVDATFGLGACELRVDDWQLQEFTCHGLISSRGLSVGHVFDTEGVHLATISQEVLLRELRRLPAAVFGPVDFRALSRQARICLSLAMGAVLWLGVGGIAGTARARTRGHWRPALRHPPSGPNNRRE